MKSRPDRHMALAARGGYVTGMTWTLPNVLTLLRLLAAPGTAIMFLYFARPWADWYALLLFLGAALTDFFDGWIARAWKQESRFGAMLDPIADKVMVVIALLVITGFSGMDPYILLPATVIIFREVFVSGLREFLGASAGLLAVTRLAKWKTTAQMVAIAVLFATGIFQHMYIERTIGMDRDMIDAIIAGAVADELSLGAIRQAAFTSWWAGVVLLWLSAALTLFTGWDYLRKSMPFLKDPS